MGWHMKLVICVQLAYLSVCLTQLSVVREWTSLDVQLPPGDGQESRRSIDMLFDINSWLMYKDRVFVTLSRQPYYLAYLDLTDNSTSPLLRPYPKNRQIKIHYLVTVRVDRCDRLWVIPVMNDYTKRIIIIDLKTDSILRNITFPDPWHSYNMAFDDFDCDNEYVYISSNYEVWTYSWADGDLWQHDIIFDYMGSMILAPNSIVYYNVRLRSKQIKSNHYKVGFGPTVYSMSTTHLKDKSNKMIDIRGFGRRRNLNVKLAKSAFDPKSDVLYYFNKNETTIHAVPCLTSVRCSLNCQDVSIDPTHTLRYITVDENGYLWAVTRSFDGGKIKLRLSSVAVKSICIESNDNDTTNTSTYR